MKRLSATDFLGMPRGQSRDRNYEKLSRRDILRSTPMLTAMLLLPQYARGQQRDQNPFEGLISPYTQIAQQFTPTVSVGNVAGRVADLPVFQQLASGAPSSLVSSFDQAMTSFSSRAITAASADYFAFRLEGAGNRNDRATQTIAGDVFTDNSIVIIIDGAVSHDLAVFNELSNDDDVSVSVFLLQLLELREQSHLLRAEELRLQGGAAIYLPVQQRNNRSLTAENERLNAEVIRLRTALARLEDQVSELLRVILGL